MKSLPALRVEPLVINFDEVAEAGDITPYSALFRPDTRLSDVLGLALERTAPDNPFRVISAGCSFGAEIDSILGTVQYNSPRHTTVLGVDANPQAVQAAKSGKYQLLTGLATYHKTYDEAGIDFDQTMQRMQFNLQPDQYNTGLHTLDTNELRQQHHVTVLEADLTRGLPTKKLAQVVMCNNVLFHLDPDTAENIANDLAQHVAPNGILSFGANPAQTGMEANQGIDYLTWLRQMGTKFEEQGLEPALFAQDVAFAFQRIH
jgi:chemotaxis methyl-accepting protein methylase